MENKIVKIEARYYGEVRYSVVATYVDGTEFFFGHSRIKSGANRMVTTYTNMMRKRRALAENFTAIKAA